MQLFSFVMQRGLEKCMNLLCFSFSHFYSSHAHRRLFFFCFDLDFLSILPKIRSGGQQRSLTSTVRTMDRNAVGISCVLHSSTSRATLKSLVKQFSNDFLEAEDSETLLPHL